MIENAFGPNFKALPYLTQFESCPLQGDQGRSWSDFNVVNPSWCDLSTIGVPYFGVLHCLQVPYPP
ncbi:hypothetical protein Sjap_010418 [Stephania japonica]|uniref:Uncharacterized protein n=1 Tax=Stephania japonica TaxID=461633 RepID=A0AAP0JBD8_9MAGN